MVLASRRPGIRFEVPAPAVAPGFPRMDVAGFVGFAARGPLDRAVRVESATELRRVFGEDLVLCRDEEGRPVHALLCRAAEAFFAQGGRRAYVVRVAVGEEFSASSFIDNYLVGETAHTIPALAEYRHHVDPTSGGDGVPLRGMHALWTIGELSMVAAPDAVHRAWRRRVPVSAAELVAPWVEVMRHPDGRVELSWLAVPGADAHRVQRSDDTQLGRATESVIPGGPHPVVREGACAPTSYFRVRAEAEGRAAGPWSNTVAVAWDDFEVCGRAVLESPRLVRAPGGELSWTVVAGAQRYLVEEGSEPELADAREWSTAQTTLPLPAGPVATRFFRVRAEGGLWSNTIAVEGLAAAADLVVDAVDAYVGDELLAIHRALLRMCAARGDLMAVLSLPPHVREDAAVHRTRLRTTVLPSAPSLPRVWPPVPQPDEGLEARGTLFHPWILEAPERLGSPDGHLLGSAARRTVSEGPWRGPANQPLRDALGVAPVLDRDRWSILADGGVSPVEHGPRGVLATIARTLSDETTERDWIAMRVGCLVRKVLLELGDLRVFEPQGRVLRVEIESLITEAMLRLWRAGALAGRTPDEAFWVRVRDLAADRDGGRVVAEIGFAPSRPLEHIVVELVETGGLLAVRGGST